MKNMFKKNVNTTTDLFENSRNVLKRAAIKNGVIGGIDALATIATPIAIVNAAKNIDDDYAKKALYATGGMLMVYQLGATVRRFTKTAGNIAGYKLLSVCDADAIAAEGQALVENFTEELKEVANDQEEK